MMTNQWNACWSLQMVLRTAVSHKEGVCVQFFFVVVAPIFWKTHMIQSFGVWWVSRVPFASLILQYFSFFFFFFFFFFWKCQSFVALKVRPGYVKTRWQYSVFWWSTVRVHGPKLEAQRVSLYPSLYCASRKRSSCVVREFVCELRQSLKLRLFWSHQDWATGFDVTVKQWENMNRLKRERLLYMLYYCRH